MASISGIRDRGLRSWQEVPCAAICHPRPRPIHALACRRCPSTISRWPSAKGCGASSPLLLETNSAPTPSVPPPRPPTFPSSRRGPGGDRMWPGLRRLGVGRPRDGPRRRWRGRLRIGPTSAPRSGDRVSGVREGVQHAHQLPSRYWLWACLSGCLAESLHEVSRGVRPWPVQAVAVVDFGGRQSSRPARPDQPATCESSSSANIGARTSNQHPTPSSERPCSSGVSDDHISEGQPAAAGSGGRAPEQESKIWFRPRTDILVALPARPWPPLHPSVEAQLQLPQDAHDRHTRGLTPEGAWSTQAVTAASPTKSTRISGATSRCAWPRR